MRIIFLCGSLQPGSDGVGDYTRRLGAELLNRENQVAIVALYDKGVKNISEEFQQIDGIKLPVLRIPSQYSSRKRYSFAKEWIKGFNPEWISLQYVPYSFQNKGLPFGIARSLQKLNKSGKWHIMFHELWVGFTIISPAKHRFIGFFQKRIAESIVNGLRPKAITTTNRLYQLLLSNSRITSTILPLFSNIPVTPIDDDFKIKIYKDLFINPTEIGQYLIAGVFGNLYPEANLENAISEQLQYAEANKKSMVLIGFGKIDNKGLTEFKRLEILFFQKVKFLHFGEQSEKNISNLMQMLDAAISCTPFPHIGKSGVFAAMKLHDLKVIVPDGDIIPEYDAEIKTYNEQFVNNPPYYWSSNYVANHFDTLIKSGNHQLSLND